MMLFRSFAPVMFAASLIAASAAAAQPGDASYPASCAYSDRSGVLERVEACATTDPEFPSLAPWVVARLGYDRGLAQIAIADVGWYYRRRDGRMVRAFTFDNGPDPFAQGLARAWISGRLAYVDRQLRVRIRTAYDWGEPFENGRAAVCIGCSLVPVDGGEHHVVSGGRWGVIDCRGKELVAVRHPAAEASATESKTPPRGCRR